MAISIKNKLTCVIFILCSAMSFSQEETKNKIQGLWWQCQIVDSMKYAFYNEGPLNKYLEPENEHYYFNGDSIWKLDYPFQYYSINYSYVIKKDSILIKDKFLGWNQIIFSGKDKFYITEFDSLSGIKKAFSFIRDTFSQNAIDYIIKNKFNESSIIGRMNLIKEKYDKNNNSVRINLPVRVPANFEIKTAKEAREIYNRWEVPLIVNGKKRMFKIYYFDWPHIDSDVPDYFLENNKNKPILVLHPDKWWKGKPFEVRYQLQ